MNAQRATPYLLLALLVMAIHGWEMKGPFIYDDEVYIATNPAVNAGLGHDWWRFWVDHRTYSAQLDTSHYRPLVAMSYAANVSMGWGMWGFKLTQLIIHLITVCVFYWIVREIGRRYVRLPEGTPFVAALLVGIMPFNVEAVHYLTGRSALLCAMFIALAFAMFLKVRQGGSRYAIGAWYLGHFVMVALALLCKETVVVFPAAMLAADLILLRPAKDPTNAAGIRYFWPYLPYAAGLLAVWALVPNVARIPHFLSQVFGQEWRLSAAMYCLVKNLRMMVLPTGLTITHPIDEHWTLFHGPFLLSTLLVALIAAGAWRVRRNMPAVTFGLVWYFLMILPSTFVHLNVVLLENRGYPASMGGALVLGFLLCRSWEIAGAYRKAVGIGLAVVAVCFSAVAVNRVVIWRHSTSVWQDAADHDPQRAGAWMNLALSLAVDKRYDEAREALLKVIKLEPTRWYAQFNLGRIAIMQGDYAAARPVLERLALYIEHPAVERQLGLVYEHLGMEDKRIDTVIHLTRLEAKRYDDYLGYVPGSEAMRLTQQLVAQGRLADAERVLLALSGIASRHDLAVMGLAKIYGMTANRDAYRKTYPLLPEALRRVEPFAGWARQLGAAGGPP